MNTKANEEAEIKCQHPKGHTIELYQIDEWPYPSYVKVKCLDCGKILTVELPQ